jgi:hypothetical protein
MLLVRDQKSVSPQYRVAAQVPDLLHYFRLIVKNYTVHAKGSSGQDVLYFVINEDCAGWVDPRLLDHMFVETYVRLPLTSICTEMAVLVTPGGCGKNLRCEYMIEKCPLLRSGFRG